MSPTWRPIYANVALENFLKTQDSQWAESGFLNAVVALLQRGSIRENVWLAAGMHICTQRCGPQPPLSLTTVAYEWTWVRKSLGQLGKRALWRHAFMTPAAPLAPMDLPSSLGRLLQSLPQDIAVRDFLHLKRSTASQWLGSSCTSKREGKLNREKITRYISRYCQKYLKSEFLGLLSTWTNVGICWRGFSLYYHAILGEGSCLLPRHLSLFCPAIWIWVCPTEGSRRDRSQASVVR